VVKRTARAILWWKNTSLILRLFYFVLLSALVASLFYVQLPNLNTDLFRSNLVFFVLINFGIIGVGVLAVIIGRNVVKLVFDRQEGILGSKLRTKLVVAFICLTLVPTTILFILASGLISTAMEGWFSRQVEEIVDSSVSVAKDHYNSLEALSLKFTFLTRQEIEKIPTHILSSNESIKILDERRKAYGFYSIRVYDAEMKIITESSSVTSEIEDFKEPPARNESLSRALNKETVVSFEEEGVRQFVRTYSPLSLSNRKAVLVATLRVSPELSTALATILSSYDEYQKMNFYKQPLKSSYVLALALITGLILLAAIWIGFYMAKEISVPIQKLAEGTREVSQGNYDVHLRLVGDDEIGSLISSFNKMTKDLKGNRNELEQRRVYLETILASLSVGVLAIDENLSVTLANQLVREFLIAENNGVVVGRKISELLSSPLKEEVALLLATVKDQEKDDAATSTKPIKMIISGREHQIVCSVEKMNVSPGVQIGSVIIFEDVTEISFAHQMAAWREAARRVAHEIKNPLTPIKLSAQRLEKIIQGSPHQAEVAECAQTIVENVESIKRLANEFSNFARMPTAEFTPCNINSLISDIIETFVEVDSNIIFQFIADQDLPKVNLDQEQIRRMMMNLVDNAIDSLGDVVNGERPKIVARTIYAQKQNRAIIEITDNGIGIKPSDKTRIFEPYFTTKSDGTGLGLAIVSTVISDHRGTIRVYDNEPRGTKMVVELPLSQPTATIESSTLT